MASLAFGHFSAGAAHPRPRALSCRHAGCQGSRANQRAIVARLRDARGGATAASPPLVVAATHLKAKPGVANEAHRLTVRPAWLFRLHVCLVTMRCDPMPCQTNATLWTPTPSLVGVRSASRSCWRGRRRLRPARPSCWRAISTRARPAWCTRRWRWRRCCPCAVHTTRHGSNLPRWNRARTTRHASQVTPRGKCATRQAVPRVFFSFWPGQFFGGALRRNGTVPVPQRAVAGVEALH